MENVGRVQMEDLHAQLQNQKERIEDLLVRL
jgi:hypothetical protein